MFNAVDDTMKKLSVPELVQIAQGMGGDPSMQYAAVQEIDLRRRHAAMPQPQTKTVIQDMAEQAMGGGNSSAAPGDPISSGVAAIAAQQQQGAPGYRDGRLVTRMNTIMDSLRQTGGYDTEGMSPEETRSLISEFMPDNSASYDEADRRAKDSDYAARQQRNSNLWLALAQGGLGLADRGRWGDVMPAFASAQGAIDDFNTQLNRNEDRRTRTGEQRRADANDRGARGIEALLRSRSEAGEERRSMRRDAAGLAETEARLAQEQDQVRQMAGYLMEANRGRPVTDPERPYLNRDGQLVPGQRYYSEQDALQDAITILSGGRGRSGSSPDDLNEILRSASILADRTNGAPQDVRERAQQTLDDIMSGRLGNESASTTRRESPTGARAPSERAPQVSAAERERLAAAARNRSGRTAPSPHTYLDENGNPVTR